MIWTLPKLKVWLRDAEGRFAEGDYSPVFEAMREAMLRSTEKAFQTRTSPQGKSWGNLASGGLSTLVRTGTLKDAVFAGIRSAEGSARSLRVTIDTPSYAGFIADGTRKMRARKYLGISSNEMAKLKRYIARVGLSMIDPAKGTASAD